MLTQQNDTNLKKGWYFVDGNDAAEDIYNSYGILFVYPYGNNLWKLKIIMSSVYVGIAVNQGSSTWYKWKQTWT